MNKRIPSVRGKLLIGVLLALVLALGLGYAASAQGGGAVTVKFVHGEGGDLIAGGNLSLTAPKKIGAEHNFRYWMVDGERQKGRTIVVDMSKASVVEAVYNPLTGKMTVVLPQKVTDAGGVVDINGGPQGLTNGKTFDVTEGQNFSWKLRIGNFSSAWKTGTGACGGQLEVKAADYCEMEVAIPPLVAGVGGVVDINGGPQGLTDGAKVVLPTSINVSWKLRIGNFSSAWKSKPVDCTALEVQAADYCEMEVDIPPLVAGVGGVVDINGGPQGLTDGAKVVLPTSINVSWKLRIGNFSSAWKSKHVDCTALEVQAADYCEMEVGIPPLVAGVGGVVDINGGPQGLTDGAKVVLPTSINVSWKLRIGNFSSAWKTKHVDCSALTVLPADYCEMEVVIPEVVANAGGVVDINGGPQGLTDGAKVVLPTSINVSWKLRIGNFSSAWKSKPVDCTALEVKAADYCEMMIQMPPELAKLGGVVDINGGPQGLKNGDKVVLPQGINISWKLRQGNSSSAWQTKLVDCTALVVDPKVTIKLPPGVYIYAENIGWFQDGTTFSMIPGKTYRYDAYDSTKKVHTGWKNKVFTAANYGKVWDLTGEYCYMAIDLDGGDGYVYIENVGWFKHGDQKWMPSGASFRYDAYDSTQKVHTGWQTKKVDCTALKPGYCNMLIDLDDGDGKVYIENVGWFQNGNHKWMPKGASFRYDAYDSTQKVRTGWQTKQVGEDCSALKPGYCHMLVDLDGGDGWVYIENVGWFGNGAQKWMPTGASFRYDAYDSTQKVHTGWQTKQIGEDCSALKPGYCNMLIDLEEGGDGYVYIENVGWFGNGEYKWMPTGASFRYDAYDSTKKVHTGWQTKEVDQDCSALKPGYCHMLVDLDGGDGKVVIENVGWFNNGDYKWMPKGASFRYDAYDSTQKVHTGWQTKEVDQDCSALEPGYCDMLVDLDGGDGKVLIENVGWFNNGDHKWMPTGASFRYDAYDSSQKVHTGWQIKEVDQDCSALKPGYCNMLVSLEAGVWAKVLIENVGWFTNGNYKWMPMGASFRYDAYDVNGAHTGWQTKTVDCTPLVPQCKVHIVLPSGVWVEISGVGWFQNDAWLDVKPVKGYRYRLWNAAKSIAGPWKDKQFSAADCGKDWNLTGEYCNLDIDLGASDGWVEISGVGWFQTATDVAWLPNGATVRYRLWNKAKSIAGPWKNKPIDCTPLQDDDFCNLDVDLGASDGWVEISGVGWFQTATGVAWLPNGASVNYRLWNKAKSIAGPWKNKPIDCTPLQDDDFCNLDIDLGASDGWVEISGVGWFQTATGVAWLPNGASVNYRLWNKAKSIAGPWKNKPIDCTPLQDDDFCNLDIDLGASDGWVEISGVGWFQTATGVAWLPKGASVNYRLWNKAKSIAGPWKNKPIDCTPLEDDDFCYMKIVLTDPSDGWFEISGVGWFQNGGQVWLPMGATVRYRVWNASKTQVVADWKDKSVDCNDLVYP